MVTIADVEKLAIDILVDCSIDEGEPFYYIDHEDLKGTITGNYIGDNEEELQAIVELIPQIDLEKLNEKALESYDDAIISIQCCRAEYGIC